MFKFFKSLPYHAKNATNNILRNFANATSSIFAVTVTLILIMLFSVLAINISGFTTNVEKNVQILARVDAVVESDDYTKLENEIKAIKHVSKVEFSSQEDELEKFLLNKQNEKKHEDLKTNNPLPAAFYIDADEGKYVESVAKSVENINGILDTNYGGDTVEKMISGFNSVRTGGGIFVIVLCFLAIFMISNTIKINIHNRREEIAIMRNVGASNGFIKIPFLLEGIFIGILGAIIPIVITIFGYGFLFDSMKGQFFTPMFHMRVPIPFVLEISLILLSVGIIVGLFGSLLSVNKYLKFKR